jgi:hypothetical protein
LKLLGGPEVKDKKLQSRGSGGYIPGNGGYGGGYIYGYLGRLVVTDMASLVMTVDMVVGT